MKKYDSYKDSGVDWIGKVPSNWGLMTIRRITQDHKQGYYSSDGYKEEGYKLVRITDLDANGNIDTLTSPFVNPTEKELEVFEIKKGDILFPRTGSIGLVGVAKNDMKAVFASYLIRFRFSDKTNNSFMRYFFISEAFLNGLYSDLHGGVNQNIHAENIKDQWISLPSLNEQIQITNFLDHKTSQIDHLIAKKEQFIKLLEEERIAVINQAVTKGLDPNVPMKDSGVEWLGEIPEHWEVKRLKFIGNSIGGLTYSPNDIVESSSEGVLVLRSSNIQNGKLSLKDNVYVNLKISDKLTLKKGDILICSRNGSQHLIGKNICIDEQMEGNTFGAFMMIFRSNNWKFLSHYFNSSIFTSQSGLFLTATINQLTSNTLNNFFIAIPKSNDEQILIAEYIDNKTHEIDCIINKSVQEIELLKEYKTALISEVVTGKVDVSTSSTQV